MYILALIETVYIMTFIQDKESDIQFSFMYKESENKFS